MWVGWTRNANQHKPSLVEWSDSPAASLRPPSPSVLRTTIQDIAFAWRACFNGLSNENQCSGGGQGLYCDASRLSGSAHLVPLNRRQTSPKAPIRRRKVCQYSPFGTIWLAWPSHLPPNADRETAHHDNESTGRRCRPAGGRRRRRGSPSSSGRRSQQRKGARRRASERRNRQYRPRKGQRSGLQAGRGCPREVRTRNEIASTTSSRAACRVWEERGHAHASSFGEQMAWSMKIQNLFYDASVRGS